MATWAIEEQTIPLTGVEGTLTSMDLRVDHPDAAYMIMDLHAGTDTYELRFARNGAFTGWRKVEPPPEVPLASDVAAEEEHHSSKTKSKK